MPRQQIYTLLIVISAALMFGRIMAVDRVDFQQLQNSRLAHIQSRLDAKEADLRTKTDNEEGIRAELEKTRQNLLRDAMFETPMLSGNDRSRWCTIRALVEPDMRVVRKVTNQDGTERYEYVWYAIDKVQDVKGWDTIDMVKHGRKNQPEKGYLYSSKPPLLPTLMAIPYAVMYLGSNGRITLENHPYYVVRITLLLVHLLPLVVGWFLLARLIERFGTTDWGRIFCVAFVCFGTFLSTFVVTLNNHLPAVFCVTVAMYCGVRVFFDGETRLRYFFCAGFCSAFVVFCELPALSFLGLLGLAMLLKFPKQTLLAGAPAALLVLASHCITNYTAHETVIPAYGKRDWYFYEYERGGIVRDSYWKNPIGVDRGEPNRGDYILHSTVGHHGIFLLTPVWILSFLGLGMWLVYPFDVRYRWTALGILLMSFIVFAFYMAMEQGNRNYGGMTCALRWMFWFAPMWSVPLVSVADRLSYLRIGRVFCLLLLAVSVFSAAYPIWNPWSMPWPYRLMVYWGWPVI